MNTTSNKLSLWEVDDGETNVEIIALAVAATMPETRAFNLVWIGRGDLERLGLELESELGVTPVVSAQLLHRNVVALSAEKLVRMTETMYASAENGRVKSYTRIQCQQLLKNGIDGNAVEVSQLEERMREELRRLGLLPV